MDALWRALAASASVGEEAPAPAAEAPAA